MHLAYVDDSGDPRGGITMTALLVEERNWSALLGAWLNGRHAVHRAFGVRLQTELHATELFKGRKSFCDTREQDAEFGPAERAATARILLSGIARDTDFRLVTVAGPFRSRPDAYQALVQWLNRWAAGHDSHVVIFYDGPQGLPRPHEESSSARWAQRWEDAVRNAGPYRRAHRSLDLDSRRIIEDVVMRDSRYHQLIQAADLLAYGAYHHHRASHPDLCPGTATPVPAAVTADLRTRAHWVPDTEDGIVWIEPTTQEPPA